MIKYLNEVFCATIKSEDLKVSWRWSQRRDWNVEHNIAHLNVVSRLQNYSLRIMDTFKQIEALHGRAILKDVRLLEKLRLQIAQKVMNLEFFKKCRDAEVIACFAEIKHLLNSGRNNHLFKSLSLKIVRIEVKKTCAIINKISEKVYHMHLYLSHIIKANI